MTCNLCNIANIVVFIFILYIIYMGYREVVELKHLRGMIQKAREFEAKEIRVNMIEHALRAVMYFVIALVTALFMWG